MHIHTNPITLLAMLATAIQPSRATIQLTADHILAIAPKSATCDDNAPAVGECVTAEQAAPFINESFDTYNIDSAVEQAALVGLMAFETGEFKYNRNHFPGVAGQGTRNMQSPTYNEKYAASIPELAQDYASVSGNPSEVLNLLLANEVYDFGSAAWFLTTQCSDSVRSQLREGSDAGWEAYITSCIGTTVTDDRRAYWKKAVGMLVA